jgi:myo-inositol-1(or 4)-monophosphatase
MTDWTLPVSRETLLANLDIARVAALEAGRALRDQSAQWNTVDSETDRDVKLAADREAEAIILRHLAKTPFRVLSEEAGWGAGEQTDLVWAVDPLDGTANYQVGIPLCAVSIGLVYNRRPVVGAVYAFPTDEMFLGAEGHGASLNGRPIRASTASDPAKGILATGFPAKADMGDTAMAAFTNRVRAWRKIRMIGSAALAVSYVACGRAHAYREENTNLWDIAGACAIASASGAEVIIEGEPIDGPLTVTVHAPGMPPP